MTAAADLRGLRDVLPESRLSFGESDRRTHGEDVGGGPPALPDVVAYPVSTGEVAAVLAWADERRVPVVAFGAGTGLERHAVPERGGISLDLRHLDKVVAVRPQELTATTQAGVTRLAFERATGAHGLVLPVDPGADATLGGMAATNAAGTMTLRHGKMRDRVLALEAVLPGGRVVRTGTRARKTSAGYDLTSLLVGSEGTLAIITELDLRLEPVPERTATVRAALPTIDAACEAVQALLPLTAVRRIELLDPWEVMAANRFSGTALPETPLLLVEAAGDEPVVASAVAEVEGVLAGHGARALEAEHDHTAQQRLWRVRHDVFFAELAMAPGRQSVSTDVCVPVSALADTVRATRRRLDEHGLTGGIVAHAGDGNVHAGILVDPGDPDERARLDACLSALVDDALAVGGTCTGEHGIGSGKRGFLAREHGDLVPLMRAVKDAFDPHGILNPGKVLPGT